MSSQNTSGKQLIISIAVCFYQIDIKISGEIENDSGSVSTLPNYEHGASLDGFHQQLMRSYSCACLSIPKRLFTKQLLLILKLSQPKHTFKTLLTPLKKLQYKYAQKTRCKNIKHSLNLDFALKISWTFLGVFDLLIYFFIIQTTHWKIFTGINLQSIHWTIDQRIKLVVGVNQLSAHRSERNWHRPEEFCPERFLPEAKD